MASVELGPLLRLHGIPASVLPPASASPEDLAPFIISLLAETLPFVDSVEPKAPAVVTAMVAPPENPWTRRRKARTYPDASEAAVEVLERGIALKELERIERRFERSAASGYWGKSQRGVDCGEGNGYNRRQRCPGAGGDARGKGGAEEGGKLRAEHWIARRSVHRDSAERGTANWAEFRAAFRDHHAETELASTPDVVAIREAVVYERARELVVEMPEDGTWKVTGLKVLESRHHVPAPLGDRCFASLQLVVQAVKPSSSSLLSPDAAGGPPVTPTTPTFRVSPFGAPGEEPGAEPACSMEIPEFTVINLSLRGFPSHPASELARLPHVVPAAFTSVERIRKMKGGQIEWIMALASAAGGVLPGWVQDKAIPGQIAKDVPLFFGWIATERQTPSRASPLSSGGDGAWATAAGQRDSAYGDIRRRSHFVGEKVERRRDKEYRERERMREREQRKSRKSMLALERASGVYGPGGAAGARESTRSLVKRKSMDFMRRRSGRIEGHGDEDVPVPPLPRGIADGRNLTAVA